MSNTKTVMSQAANTQGIPLDITEVFSTYLYTGNSSTQTITNGIDLDGEGGLVWLKTRSSTTTHALFDTERGISNKLSSDTTGGASASFAGVSAFNSDGFSLGNIYNTSPVTYASWTFRKAPKFFDVVTYTGTGIDQLIPHNLGCVPGFVVVKKTSATGYWSAWHRTFTSNEYILLDLTIAATPTANVRTVTDTHYEVHGNYPDENQSSATYVAYLFAHNDGDGEFGPDGDQDIIKCGSYTGNSGGAINVELGFEPQWLMIKNASSGSNWVVLDVMRGFSWDAGNNLVINANADHAEQDVDENGAPRPTPTGFSLASSGQYGEYNFGTNTYIYIAIRRGPLAPPESATEVFDVDAQNTTSTPLVTTGFPVDLAILTSRSGARNSVVDRLRGSTESSSKRLFTDGTDAETSSGGGLGFDNNIGYTDLLGGYSDNVLWSFRRAPNFFDVVAYTGDGATSRTVSHNLGVAPEMMWIKCRNTSDSWVVYAAPVFGQTGFDLLSLSDSDALPRYTNNVLSSTPVSDTSFNLGSYTGLSNGAGNNYIAYLFATLPGVSKVGSYTGNGSSQTIDCGFTSGARFILIKRTDSTGDWYIWDTERGIVAGNDPHLSLNTTASEVTSDDSIDPDNSGFIVNQVAATNINVSSASYIFYAIA